MYFLTDYILDISIYEGYALASCPVIVLSERKRGRERGKGERGKGKEKRKGSYLRQTGVLTHFPVLLHGHFPSASQECWTWLETLHHPLVPWSSYEAEMCVRTDPEGFNFNGVREGHHGCGSHQTLQQMLRS